MIFGRRNDKTSAAADVDDAVLDETNLDETDLDQTDAAEADLDDADLDQVDQAEAQSDEVDDDPDDEVADQWVTLDESRDWREDGPFDWSEVDLSQDAEAGIERIDLGSLIVTPEEDIAVQLQLVQETGQVQALVAVHENSGLEVALFAAPAKSSMLPEVREGLSSASAEVGGHAEFAEGPFGTEVRRLLPLTGPEGESLLHPSRLWLVQGPRWLLRGVLMGEAGMQDTLDGSAGVLMEFFKNIVVRRDSQPRVPGDLVLLKLPEGMEIADETGGEVDAEQVTGDASDGDQRPTI